jgi:hypothetical protein
MRLRALLQRGLEATAGAWPDVRAAYRWVHRAASVLTNEAGLDAAGVRRRYRGLVAAMSRHAGSAGRLRGALERFRKVTRSYWAGLFHCYDVADLPRTNNDLEQSFGSYRYHERRASGRKAACPGTVVRGSVRIIAATASRLRVVAAEDLIPSDPAAWRSLRESLARRQAVRARGRRFRRDPAAYLHELEQNLIKRALPP